MSTDLVIQGGALAVTTDQTAWTPQQLAVLQSAGVSEQVTPAELDQFLHECQRTGLDPFSRQIYLIGRYDKQAGRDVFRSQTGIDGYRVVAHRAAKRDHTTIAYSETLWCGPDKVWCDVWLEDGPPRAAKITVFRGGEPFPATATLAEYAATYKNGDPTPMWRRMPATMLAKCAEAKALRMAFPHDLAGIYTAEEMEQADNSRREGPAQRHRGPVQDEWNTVPGEVIREQQDRDAEAPQDGPAEWNTATGAPLPPPGPAMPDPTADEINEMVRLIGVKRHVFNGHCAGVVSQLVRRPIGDPGELSQAEVRSVIETLNGEPDWTPPAADTAPAGPGTPNNPVISRTDHRQMQALFKEAGITERDDQHAFIARVLGAPVESRNNITKEQFKLLRHALTTGELPPETEPPGPNSNGEGISEFDALGQMILDVNDPQSQMDCEDAIRAEFKRGAITASDVELLNERLAEHVERAKAGAAA